VTPGQTLLRYHQLLDRYGNEEERQLNREMVMACVTVYREFPRGSLWEPMEEVYMPIFLRERAKQVARERHRRAARFYREKEGAQRSIEQETRSVLGQYAACLMLGLSLNKVTSARGARNEGNIGANVSAFIPKPGAYNLLVLEKEPPARIMVLIYATTDTLYSCRGWITAREAQQPHWRRQFTHRGVESKPYLVPPDALRPLREWFERAA